MQQSSLEELRQEDVLEAKAKSRLESVTDHLGLLIVISTLSAYLVNLNGVWTTDHSTAIVEFQYSLWRNHSFILGKVGSFFPNSVDVFQYNGNYYMANAPGIAFFTLPGAIAAFLLKGGPLDLYGNTLLFTEIPIAIANSFAAYFVFKIGNYYFRKDVSSYLAFCYAFSTISWPFATFLFQSDVSALLDLMVVFLVIKIDRASSCGRGMRFGPPVLAGLVVACGVITDYVNGILIPTIGVYLFFALRKQGRKLVGKSLLGFLSGSIGTSSLLLGLYNYSSFGKFFVSSEQLYLHSASILGNFNFPVDQGLFLNLLTPMRGLFFFSPVLLLGVWGFWEMLRDSSTDREGLLILSVFLGILMLYSAWYDPTGGLSFGPRLIVSSIPFLLLPAGFVISKTRNRFSYAFVYLLYAVGVCISGAAAFVGALAPPTKSWLVSPFFSTTLPSLLSGKLDGWWKGYAGNLSFIIMVSVLGFALLLPLMIGYVSERSAFQKTDGDKHLI
ncbi:MAG TPA: hypothetical protein VED17_07965 [Nitrososphaerales archaeon]|nr:hypothetical protein [Nitrososphaerales archaeon]